MFHLHFFLPVIINPENIAEIVQIVYNRKVSFFFKNHLKISVHQNRCVWMEHDVED